MVGGGEVVARAASGCRRWTDSLRLGSQEFPTPHLQEGCNKHYLNCLGESLRGKRQEALAASAKQHLGGTCDSRCKWAKKEQGKPNAAWEPEPGVRMEDKARPLRACSTLSQVKYRLHWNPLFLHWACWSPELPDVPSG